MSDQLPPHDQGAEEAILGGILHNPEILPKVLAVVTCNDFYFDHCQKILAAMIGLVEQGKPIDLVLLHEQLRQRCQSADTGGPARLAELWNTVPTGANAEYHARIVRECAIARRLIHAAHEILRDAYDRRAPVIDIIARAVRKIGSVLASDLSVGPPREATEDENNYY